MFPVEQPGLSCRRQEKEPSFAGIFRIQGGYLAEHGKRKPFCSMVQRIIINQRLLIFVKPYFIILVYECMSYHSVIHFSIYLLQPALGQIIFVCTLSGHTEIDITCRSNQQIADRTFYFGKYIPVYQTGPYIDTVKNTRTISDPYLPAILKETGKTILVAGINLTGYEIGRPGCQFRSFMHGRHLIISSYPTDIFLRFAQDMVFQCIIMLVYLVPRVEQNLDSYLPLFIYPGQQQIFIFGQQQHIPLGRIL